MYIKDINKLEILDQIKEIYCHNTGMVISFHSPGIKYTLDFFPKKQRNYYCSLIQSTEEGMRKCKLSDIYGLSKAKEHGEYCIYRCHAGLIDVAIPLMYKGRDIGSIYTGQVLTEEPTKERFEKLYRTLSNLDLDRSILREHYFKVKVMDKERLIFCVRLLALIGNYIITFENELNLQKEIIEKNRELHRKEREKIKLEKALRELSISILEFEKNSIKDATALYSENSRKNNIISKAQLFIKSNYNKHIMLKDVSAAVYLSPNYFSAMFKKVSGYTFSKYLVRKRIDVAKKYLNETDIPIKNIVSKVGFEDYNYFNRSFKKLIGVPPAQFRKSSLHVGSK